MRDMLANHRTAEPEGWLQLLFPTLATTRPKLLANILERAAGSFNDSSCYVVCRFSKPQTKAPTSKPFDSPDIQGSFGGSEQPNKAGLVYLGWQIIRRISGFSGAWLLASICKLQLSRSPLILQQRLCPPLFLGKCPSKDLALPLMPSHLRC